jgi:methylmalonyl-CoA mutase cobalamin-binding domain/chain
MTKQAIEIEKGLNKLITAVVNGETQISVEIAERLIISGLPIEELIHDGLTAALRSLDAKCTNEDFNLLEIMLAGRAMMAVMDNVVAKHLPSSSSSVILPDKVIVLGTIRGDIHELGKHVVKMLLKANGYKVVDIGKDVHPSNFVKAAIMEGARYIGVSSLITLTIPYIKEIRDTLYKGGLTDIKVIAGGAAIQQANADDLNVDYVARDAFDVLHYLESRAAPCRPSSAA